MGFYALLTFSVLCWQDSVLPAQPFVQLFFITCIVLFGYKHIAEVKNRFVPKLVSLSDTGQWSTMLQQPAESWQIGKQSRISPVCLWIQLTDPVMSRKSYMMSIFRDQVDERDYRRISRIILCSMQKHRHSGSGL